MRLWARSSGQHCRNERALTLVFCETPRFGEGAVMENQPPVSTVAPVGGLVKPDNVASTSVVAKEAPVSVAASPATPSVPPPTPVETVRHPCECRNHHAVLGAVRRFECSKNARARPLRSMAVRTASTGEHVQEPRTARMASRTTARSSGRGRCWSSAHRCSPVWLCVLFCKKRYFVHLLRLAQPQSVGPRKVVDM